MKKWKYLGKRRLYAFLVEEGFFPEKLEFFDYSRYRGMEFFECFGISLNCEYGLRIFVSTYVYDEEKNKDVEYSRRRFDFVHGKWVKCYESIGGVVQFVSVPRDCEITK